MIKGWQIAQWVWLWLVVSVSEVVITPQPVYSQPELEIPGQEVNQIAPVNTSATTQ